MKQIKISQDYKNSLLSKIISLPVGEWRNLANDSELELKVETIKLLINWKLDIKNGFSVTFSEDMRRIRKDAYILIQKK